MKAVKVTTTVVIETLTTDCVAPLLLDAYHAYKNGEVLDGKLVMSDGDTVQWNTKLDNVSI